MLNGSVKNMYLVVTQKKWHIDNFKKVKNKKFRLISNRKKIKYNYISNISGFFLIISPASILSFIIKADIIVFFFFLIIKF